MDQSMERSAILSQGSFINYVDQILPIIDHLPTPVEIGEEISLLHNVDISNTTYLYFVLSTLLTILIKYCSEKFEKSIIVGKIHLLKNVSDNILHTTVKSSPPRTSCQSRLSRFEFYLSERIIMQPLKVANVAVFCCMQIVETPALNRRLGLQIPFTFLFTKRS